MGVSREMVSEYIFETSWEVCNKVGGIYTVLSTRAATMVGDLGNDRVLFVGPWLDTEQMDFEECRELSAEWREALSREAGLPVRIGYWRVPGRPRCVLVDYRPLYEIKGTLYFEMWERYGIRSEVGYGDYDESCIFSIAAAKVMIAYHSLLSGQTVAIFNEWTTGMGLLYCKMYAPEIRTVFITHATTVGRSIAGNGKPLYDRMNNYHGDEMARELNVEGKHVLEKRAAWEADAFGTVSDVTDVECRQLLERPADLIVPNGFEPGFVPDTDRFALLRKRGRGKILDLVHVLYGSTVGSDALIIATSGRSEYRNKGLDVYIDALANRARKSSGGREVVALILVPGWTAGVRPELIHGLKVGGAYDLQARDPFVTHRLNEPYHNPIYNHLNSFRSLWRDTGVFPLYIPSYLDGADGVIGASYYELLPAIDLTLFPSYYEPWGYTPLESIAFGIPTVTTDKSGFGMWASDEIDTRNIESGVCVLHRNDHNADDLAMHLADVIDRYAELSDRECSTASSRAVALSHRAYWGNFYVYYRMLFDKALSRG